MDKRIPLFVVAMLSISFAIVSMPVAEALVADVSRGRGFYPVFNEQGAIAGNAFFDFKVSLESNPKYGLGYLTYRMDGKGNDIKSLERENDLSVISTSIKSVVFSVDQDGLKAEITGEADVVGLTAEDDWEVPATNFRASVWDGDPVGKADRFLIELDIDGDGALVSGQVTITNYGGTIDVSTDGGRTIRIFGANDSNTGVSP